MEDIKADMIALEQMLEVERDRLQQDMLSAMRGTTDLRTLQMP
jgi:hypothetical protein